MKKKEDYSYLNLKNVCGAGWFQWYDFKKSHEYPECHVLIYKFEKDYYCSEILDFNVSSYSNSAKESFKEVASLALEFYKRLKGSNLTFDFAPKESKYWDKYRNIYFPAKIDRFKTQDALKNEKELPFNLVKQILELKTELKGKDNKINVLEAKIKEIEESLINNEKKITIQSETNFRIKD